MLSIYQKQVSIDSLRRTRVDIIKMALEERKLSKVTLAEKAGISRQTLENYINGENLNSATLMKIAKALNIDVSILIRVQGETFEQEASREGGKESLITAEKNRFREIIEKALEVAVKLNLTAKDIIEGLIYLRKSWVFKYRKHTTKNYSSFICDITYPDDSIVLTNQIFTKKWAVQNSGEKDWCDVKLVCIDKEIDLKYQGDDNFLALYNRLIPLMREVPVPNTKSGEPAILTVYFQAPSLPCTSYSHWKMVDKNGNILLPDQKPVWCRVIVVNL